MILIDTHIWLWLLHNPSQLSEKAQAAINNPEHQDSLLVSAISVWEIAVKSSLGKLTLPLPSKLPDTDLSTGTVRAFNSPEMICNVAKQSRTFRFIYGNPKSSNILTPIQICITSPSAMTTSKLLARPIRFTMSRVDMVAIVASLRSISRLNKQDFYTMFYRFVNQELSQLVKRPTIAKPSFFLRSWLLIGALSDSRQIFQSNSLVMQFSPRYQSMADGVIYQALKAFLLARQPFQQFPTSASSTACASRSLLLEIHSKFGVMISNFGNFFTAKFISFRCNNNVSSTQIASKNIIGFDWFWWHRFKLNVQIISAIFALYQCGCFWGLPLQQPNLVVTNSQLKSFSTSSSSQAYSPVFLPKRENTRIVSNASWSKVLNWLTIFLSRFPVTRNPSNRMNSQLSRQPEHFPDIVINKGLHRQLIGQVWRHGLIHVFASRSKGLKSCINFDGLLRRYFDLAGYCQDLFHKSIILQYVRLCKIIKICSQTHTPHLFSRSAIVDSRCGAIACSRAFLPSLT